MRALEETINFIRSLGDLADEETLKRLLRPFVSSPVISGVKNCMLDLF